jgi:hypothetical protein
VDDDVRRAEDLLQCGEKRNGLRVLERLRVRALASRDLNMLRDVREIAHRVAETGSEAPRARDIVYGAEQNIRFLTRAESLARGEPWVDPLPREDPKVSGEVMGPAAHGQRRVESPEASAAPVPAHAGSALLVGKEAALSWRDSVRWWALAIWVILIIGTAVGLGATSSSPATWFAEDAGSGALLGLLFSLFVAHRDPVGRRVKPESVIGFLVGGAVLYASVYGIGILSVPGNYDSKGDQNGTLGAFVLFLLIAACLIPMLLTATLVLVTRSALGRVTKPRRDTTPSV